MSDVNSVEFDTFDKVVSKYFPNDILDYMLNVNSFYDFVRENYHSFPRYIKSIVRDCHQWIICEKQQNGFVGTYEIKSYIISAIQANIRFSNEIGYGVCYDEEDRKEFELNFTGKYLPLDWKSE